MRMEQRRQKSLPVDRAWRSSTSQPVCEHYPSSFCSEAKTVTLGPADGPGSRWSQPGGELSHVQDTRLTPQPLSPPPLPSHPRPALYFQTSRVFQSVPPSSQAQHPPPVTPPPHIHTHTSCQLGHQLDIFPMSHPEFSSPHR